MQQKLAWLLKNVVNETEIAGDERTKFIGDLPNLTADLKKKKKRQLLVCLKNVFRCI